MYPDTRLLWRDRIDTGELLNIARQRLADNYRIDAQDMIPHPGELQDPSDDESSDTDSESEATVLGDQDFDLDLDNLAMQQLEENLRIVAQELFLVLVDCQTRVMLQA